MLCPADRRGLTPLFWQHVRPYGEVRLDMGSALEEQRSEKYRHALIAVVSIGVRAGQLGGTDAWLSSHLVSHV